jgi:cytochrome P450
VSEDPLHLRVLADAAPLLEELTAVGGRQPTRIPGSSLWVVSSYADVREVLADWRSYRPWPGFEWQDPGTRCDDGVSPGAMTSPTPLAFVDPERHARMRRHLARTWSPHRYLSRLRPVLDQESQGLVRRLEGMETIDLLSDYADPIATKALTSFFGVLPDRWGRLRAGGLVSLPLGITLELLEETEIARNWPGDIAAAVEFRSGLLEEISKRALLPGDDALSDFAALTLRPGCVLDQGDIVSLVEVAEFVGRESLSSWICMALAECMARPGLVEMLHQSRRLVRPFLLDVLRLRPVTRGTLRRVSRQVRLGGIEIPVDSLLVVWLESANRDGRRFVHPHQLALDSDSHQHLSFGYGPHRCLGSSLALHAVSIAVEAFVAAQPVGRRYELREVRYASKVLSRVVVQMTLRRATVK